jgi:hypothetical protein
VIVDTGFGESAAVARGRIITRPVIEACAMRGSTISRSRT